MEARLKTVVVRRNITATLRGYRQKRPGLPGGPRRNWMRCPANRVHFKKKRLVALWRGRSYAYPPNHAVPLFS